ncbi:hypothetical protein BDV93DRAFT_567176 [Ceratobasidium sp. AG-I]|nr:hypothetical protein BDV93DRAFT_567176 [Ceratobasidium sp. AG-I]
MSLNNESAISSAVSTSRVDLLSDNGSAASVGPDRTATPGVTGTSGSNLFDLGDGDMHIVADGAKLETHRFLVKRFTGLKDRIKNDTITLDSGEPGVDAFKSAFKIIYAS